MALNRPAARHSPPGRTPLGIEITAGSVGLIVAALIAASIPQAYQGWRFGVMAAAVALFAAISLDQIALAIIAVIAFAIANGFLEDRLGQLSWHGADDLWRLLLLVIACGWGLAVGEAARQIIRLRTARRESSHVAAPQPTDTPSMKEEERDDPQLRGSCALARSARPRPL